MEQRTGRKEDEFLKDVHELIKDIIRPLYNNGQTEDLLEKSRSMLLKLEQAEPSEVRDNLINELHGCRAWAFYRRKEFELAEQEALLAGKNETALRCLAALAGYYYKDFAKLEFYASQVPASAAIDNARQILARQPGVIQKVSEHEIHERAMRWITVDPMDKINTANIMNNTGRWFFDYANLTVNCREDLVISAIGYMVYAIGLYGSGTQNLHHRAGAHFWVSKMQEKLSGKAAAISFAEMSVSLWEKQLVMDITNKNFIRSFNGAKKHLEELKST